MLINSVETQQQTYVSKRVNEWRALSSQQWVKEKLIGRSSGSVATNVKFSEKSQKRLVDNMTKMRQKRNALFMEKLELKAKEGKATELKVVHLYVKLNLFKLLIQLGKKVLQLNNNKFRTDLIILTFKDTSFDKILIDRKEVFD